MKTSNYLIGFAALASLTLVGCSDNDYLGTDNGSEVAQQGNGEITFVAGNAKTTRAGEFIGATAAEKLGGMFVVEGTKGSEETNSPSTTVVFDNYLVGYDYNSAGTTETNTNNWEYVGLQTGITTPNRMSSTTWNALHSGDTDAKSQTVKYWDYSVPQYDFIAWSTGQREAVTTDAANGQVQVTRINTGTTLKTNGFTFTAYDADDLLQCYYTDINKVLKANYGQPVTLTFKNMAAKVRIALYEKVPGYSVKDVKFYSEDAEDPTAPTDLGQGTSTAATLFITGGGTLPQSGSVTVMYPRIGSNNSTKDDYNKASVSVSPVGAGASTQTFGTLANFDGVEGNEAADNYLGRTLPDATFAGSDADKYYTAVIPNTNGQPLTLRVDYTLVSTDGSGETIKVYGAKAVVPATYTVWQPNYAYTYIFKISDNSNGWTSSATEDLDYAGLFPITFDAVVASFTDANAEQTTVTTVATPSITTYQQGHTKANNEYSKSQIAGADDTNVKDVYVQVMDNSDAPTLKTDLNTAGKSLLFAVDKANASEAEVMDALQNRTNAYNADSPIGRNGIILTKNTNIDNTVDEIVNGVDDQPITVTAGQAAKIDIDKLDAGIYAYVYVTTPPSGDERVYNVVSAATAAAGVSNYYEVAFDGTETPIVSGTAVDGYVYFVDNVDAEGRHVSYTFKQTKVGDSVAGLVGVEIPADKATLYTSGNFYFDVYNQNKGEYAVKVIKVVN